MSAITTTGVLALFHLVLHGRGGSLSDRLPIPLADRGEHVEHQATGGASSVDLLADGEQRDLARA